MTISLIFSHINFRISQVYSAILSKINVEIAAFGFIATRYDDRIPPSMKFFLRDFFFLSQSLVLKSPAKVFYREISVFRIASVQIKPFMQSSCKILSISDFG